MISFHGKCVCISSPQVPVQNTLEDSLEVKRLVNNPVFRLNEFHSDYILSSTLLLVPFDKDGIVLELCNYLFALNIADKKLSLSERGTSLSKPSRERS